MPRMAKAEIEKLPPYHPKIACFGTFFYEREASLHLIEAAYLVFSFRWLNLNLIQQPILCL